MVNFNNANYIVRPETEQWTAELIWRLKSFISINPGCSLRILDLCSGSGCISLAIAYHISVFIRNSHLNNASLQIEGIDINPRATQLASLNAKRLLPKVGTECTIKFRTDDLFSPDFVKNLETTNFDLIISNPPYIRPDEYDHDLDADVREWEDHRALVGTKPNYDGLMYFKRILGIAPSMLRAKDSPSPFTTKIDIPFRDLSDVFTPSKHIVPLPKLVLEYGGSHQTQELIALSARQWRRQEVWRDFGGRDRTLALT